MQYIAIISFLDLHGRRESLDALKAFWKIAASGLMMAVPGARIVANEAA